jgi:SAM-dependent methyltransferase
VSERERPPRPVEDGDPATIERIWGGRISGLEGGYSEAYNAERRVDERLMSSALGLAGRPGLALDVGSFYPEMPKRLTAQGWSVVCVDLSEEVCRTVQAVGAAEALRLRAVRCDAAALPFRHGAFDLVTDFTTSVVTPDAAAVVAEEARVLKPGAVYVLVTNNRWTRSSRHNLRRQRRAGGRHPRWGYFSPLSPAGLWRIARTHGLRLVRIDSEVHSFGVVGVGLSVLGAFVPAVRRMAGWRVGGVYVKRPAQESPRRP